MRTLIVRFCVVAPAPWQSGHGSSMIWPLPRHSTHGSLKPKAPWLRLTYPLPPQFGQRRGAVPGRAPSPPQVLQVAGPESRSGIVTPRTASSKPSVTSAEAPAPRPPEAERAVAGGARPGGGAGRAPAGPAGVRAEQPVEQVIQPAG